jgi:hypothetical protein
MSSPSSLDPGSEPESAGPSSSPSGPSGQGPRSDFDISEEYGTARKNLPPAGIVAICVAAVIVIVAAYALTHRAHALSSGTIDDVVAVPVLAQNMVMAAINVSIQNNSQKPSWIHTIEVALDTPNGKFTDDASPAVDAQRYFQAFPDLKQHALNILTPETRLDPGNRLSGTIVVSFPVSLDAFNSRKSLTVTIAPYDEVPMVLTR